MQIGRHGAILTQYRVLISLGWIEADVARPVVKLEKAGGAIGANRGRRHLGVAPTQMDSGAPMPNQRWLPASAGVLLLPRAAGLKSTEGGGVAMAVRRLGQQQVTNVGVGMRSSHPSTTPDRIEGSCPTDAAPSRLATPATHLIELPKPAVVEAKVMLTLLPSAEGRRCWCSLWDKGAPWQKPCLFLQAAASLTFLIASSGSFPFPQP